MALLFLFSLFMLAITFCLRSYCFFHDRMRSGDACRFQKPFVSCHYSPQGAMTYAEKLERLPVAITSVLPLIDVERKWFSVCKGIMKLKLVGDSDFNAALLLICQSLPEELRPKIKAHDIQKLDALTLARDADLWNKADSPVGKYTPEYQTIYRMFMAFFE